MYIHRKVYNFAVNSINLIYLIFKCFIWFSSDFIRFIGSLTAFWHIFCLLPLLSLWFPLISNEFQYFTMSFPVILRNLFIHISCNGCANTIHFAMCSVVVQRVRHHFFRKNSIDFNCFPTILQSVIQLFPLISNDFF